MVAGILLAAAALAPGLSEATHTRLARASVDNDGSPSGWSTNNPSASADGTRVAFDVYGSLLPEDRNYDYHDVYLRDLAAARTVLVSVAPDGGPAYGNNALPVVSGNGRYVAFLSDASNLVSGDTNATTDVFVRDLDTETTTRASVGTNEEEANGGTTDLAISDDGRTVAFLSSADNLVPGDTSTAAAVFVRDLETETTTIASVSSSGALADAGALEVALSGDGSTVAFTSQSTNLAPGDTATCGMRLPPVNCADVFVHDMTTGETTRITNGPSGQQANDASGDVTLSADGGKVAFTSVASNLVLGSSAGRNIFVADTSTGAITLATPPEDGRPEGAMSSHPSIRRDGTAVIFESGSTADNAAIFIRDLVAGQTTRPTFMNNGTQGNEPAHEPALSGDGRIILFQSAASDLGGANNGSAQTYVFDTTPAPTQVTAEPALVRRTADITMRARLVEEGTETGIGGRNVRFLTAAGDIEICNAITSAWGSAVCTSSHPSFLPAIPGYRVVFEGDAQFLPSEGRAIGFELQLPPCTHPSVDSLLANLGVSCA